MSSQNKWDQANTIMGLEMKLLDVAEGWWTFFKEDHHNSSKKWETIKSEFLKQYSQEATGIKIQWTIEDVHQKNDKNIYTFAI